VLPDFLTRILITFDLLLNESVGSGQQGGRWATLLPNSISLILLIFHFRYRLCSNFILYDVAIILVLRIILHHNISLSRMGKEFFLIEFIHVSYRLLVF
jgi:hypothetical protein